MYAYVWICTYMYVYKRQVYRNKNDQLIDIQSLFKQ